MADADQKGTYFAVWARSARQVSVLGDFNDWAGTPMTPRDQSGIWETFIPGVGSGDLYKYRVVSADGHPTDKADPFAFCNQLPPDSASGVWDLNYDWSDREWMRQRKERNGPQAPISIYEVHLGSWMRDTEAPRRLLSYREMAPKLADYVRQMGFTHVELLPPMEHPLYDSWGYQVCGHFAPTSRYGCPQDLMFLVDHLHQQDIGVILDWVPSGFPADEHGLAFFDGTHLYEHSHPRQSLRPDGNTCVFNYGRLEVRSFLLSSALFWLDHYHVDGLRIDAVASMVYQDRPHPGRQSIPNRYGSNQNLEAVEFLRQLNTIVHREYADVQTIAEESTSWPRVSHPVDSGGLGFGMKWDTGWITDTLEYMALEAADRKYQHGKLTFRMLYAYAENFVLALSHDEVVHGKGSLLEKMPGLGWQKRANLRLLLAYLFSLPGKKLLFMGGEFGQQREWSHEGSLDWHLLKDSEHAALQRWVRDLNGLYRHYNFLHQHDFNPDGFQWIECDDASNSVLSFVRKDPAKEGSLLIVVLNFTPRPQPNYRLGVPQSGFWKEVLNSDARDYGGNGRGNLGGVESRPDSRHGHPFSLTLYLPPLGAVLLRPSH